MERSGLYHDLYREYDVIDRVAHLPVVNSTLTAVHDYYTKMKKDYPKFAPYFQAAENITYSAAILALRSSKPVVDKFGPTINAYANTGLDKLEGSIPLIKKHPSEVIEETKSSASNMITSNVDRALCITEEYVDYYLPCDDNDDSASTDGVRRDASVQTDEEKQSDAKERLNIISHKVKQRSYSKAMQSWSGIRTRSEETLNKLNFTVDLIQYAKTCLSSTKKSKKNVRHLQMKDLESDDEDGDLPVFDEPEQKQININFEPATINRQLNSRITDNIFSDKTYSMILATARVQMQMIEEILFHVLENITQVPPVVWMTLNFDEDPLDGIGMDDLEQQLNDRPVDGDAEQAVEVGPPQRDSRRG